MCERMKNHSLRLVLYALVVFLLSSCYTNINQAWFNRQYEGYRLDYHTEASAGIQGLPPVLYRSGDDWYIAGVQSRVEDQDTHLHSFEEDFYARHNFKLIPLEGNPVRYHKITPEMALWMQRSDQHSYEWFTSAKVCEELDKAGGDWLEQLPKGAKAVPAAFLKTGRARAKYVALLRDESAWYAYPMSGLTFLCIDVPYTAVLSTITTVLFLAVSGREDEEEKEEEEKLKEDPPPYDASPGTAWETL